LRTIKENSIYPLHIIFRISFFGISSVYSEDIPHVPGMNVEHEGSKWDILGYSWLYGIFGISSEYSEDIPHVPGMNIEHEGSKWDIPGYSWLYG
jgi:hypothetical protein